MQVLSDGLAEGITVGNDVTYTMTSLGRVYSILWPVVACAECVASKYGQGDIKSHRPGRAHFLFPPACVRYGSLTHPMAFFIGSSNRGRPTQVPCPGAVPQAPARVVRVLPRLARAPHVLARPVPRPGVSSGQSIIAGFTVIPIIMTSL
jgi:hypothetical protein